MKTFNAINENINESIQLMSDSMKELPEGKMKDLNRELLNDLLLLNEKLREQESILKEDPDNKPANCKYRIILNTIRETMQELMAVNEDYYKKILFKKIKKDIVKRALFISVIVVFVISMVVILILIIK